MTAEQLLRRVEAVQEHSILLELNDQFTLLGAQQALLHLKDQNGTFSTFLSDWEKKIRVAHENQFRQEPCYCAVCKR